MRRNLIQEACHFWNAGVRSNFSPAILMEHLLHLPRVLLRVKDGARFGELEVPLLS